MKAVTVDEALHLWNEALREQHHSIESIVIPISSMVSSALVLYGIRL